MQNNDLATHQQAEGDIFAVFMQKGGTGKTTTTIQLAGQLGRKKKKVLVVDMDPQGSITNFFLKTRNLKPAATMYHFIVERKALAPVKLNDYLWLLPANEDLTAVEHLLTTLPHTREKPNYALRNVLWPARNLADYLIIDSPPSLGLLAKNVLASVTPRGSVLVPVQTEELPIVMLPKLLTTVEDVKRDINAGSNPDLRIKHIIPTMFDSRQGLHQGWLNTIKEQYGDLVYPEPVKRLAAYGKAIDEGTDVAFQEPNLAEYWEKLTKACFS